jgi:hypothetical protein
MRVTTFALLLFALSGTTALAESAPPVDSTRIAIAPGYSIAVAKGWMACDPAINAQIGGLPLPEFFAKDMCGDPPKDMILPLVKPELGGFSAVMVGVDAHSVAPFDLGTMTDSDLQDLKNKLCHLPFFAAQPSAQCDLEISTAAGQPAVTGVLLAPGDGGMAMKVHIVVIPQAGAGMVMFLFVRAALGTTPDKFADDADMTAMIASLAKQ